MFRSFNAINMGSVDQRTAKLLAFKVGGLKKKSAARPRPKYFFSSIVAFSSEEQATNDLKQYLLPPKIEIVK